MSDLSHIKTLLADDVTKAALRADGLDPRDFLRTLEGAAARLQATRLARRTPVASAAAACWSALAASSARCGA